MAVNNTFDEVNKAIKSNLPKEFSDFINNNSGKWKQKKTFVRIVDDRFSERMTLENVFTPSEIITAWENMIDEKDFFEAKLLPFGETLGSPVVCIGYAKENHGQIFVFDFDFFATRISNSITEFLSMLE